MKILSRFFLGDGTSITYPHTNAFACGSRVLVYARAHRGIRRLFARDLESGETTRLPDVPADTMWHDVASHAPRVAAIDGAAVWILDLENPGPWKCVYRPGPAAHLDGLCSLSHDGSRLLCMEDRDGIYRGLEIDVATGGRRELFSQNWYADHIHYCPHDQEWIGFSHAGPTEQTPDRCWVWHPEEAPRGRVAFDQASEEPGKWLYVGHERWGAHDISGYVIAYAVSPAGRRGLYEIFGDGRPARLLWENDVLWHCNMDPSGRFAIVDTTGPFREEKLSEEEFRAATERHVQTDRDRGQNASDVVLIDLQTRRTLLVATVQRAAHPYHPHPAISPDRKWIIWNDASPETRGAWLAAVSLG